jgi:hypothetical protein
MVKVRPQTPPRADTGVGLTGARNEFVSFQVVVNGNDTGASAVTLAFPGLNGPNGASIGGPDITLYREAYLDISTPSFPDSATGLWPDGLIPDKDEIAGEHRSAFPFSVPAQNAQAVWVDIHIPQSAPPGVYTGAAAVSGAQGLSRSVQVTLTVAPFTLPSTPSLSTAFLLDYNLVCQAHTGNTECNFDDPVKFGLLSRYAQMGLEHRLTLTNLWPAPAAGGGWATFDTYAAPFMNGTTAARLPGATATTLQYMGPLDVASYAGFQSHLSALGWLSRAFDYTGDEPPLGASYAAIQSRAALVRAGAPNLATLVTTTTQNAASGGILADIDNITPVVNWLDGDAAPYNGDQRPLYAPFLAQGPVKKLWAYQSCMSQGCASGSAVPENTASAGWPTYLVDAAAGRNRGMEWVSFLEQVQGELYYETAMSLPNAWSSVWAFNGNGDGDLFYPGTPGKIGGSTDVPVASLRMKMIRMGLQDYEWLKRVADQGDPAFAKAVAKALVPNAWQVPDDGAAFERAKLQLVARLNQQMGVVAGPAVQGGPPASPARDVASAVTKGQDPVTSYVPMPPLNPGNSPASGVGSGAAPSSSATANVQSGSGHSCAASGTDAGVMALVGALCAMGRALGRRAKPEVDGAQGSDSA